MRIKAASETMLTLLLISMLTFSFDIRPVKTEPATITVPDDCSTIQEAVDAAEQGDSIFVKSGTYYEHVVVVNKSVSLIGENKYNTIVDGNFAGTVINVWADNVNINGFTIQNSGPYPNCGILAQWSNGNNISLNIITNNYFGIRLDTFNTSTVSGNSITNNYYGISLQFSCNNNLSGNNITNNYYGIGVRKSSNNIYRNNYLNGNIYSFEVTGQLPRHFINNDVDTSNTVDGKPIYYWINRQDDLVPLDAGYVALVNSTNIVVENLNLTRCGQGMLLAYTTNSTIAKNNITNNYYGIYLWDSSNNTIYHNNFVNNTDQAHLYISLNNVWDDGYPSGGNFWSDYGGPDADSDGIGDIPYVIDETNQDNYPLMSIWGDVDLEPPVADAGPDLTADAGTTVTFNGSKSFDDVAIKSYVWTFTDITPQTLTGVQPTYTFNNIGDFEVTLNVSDYAGNWNTDTVTITVQLPEHELVASMTAPTSLQLGSSSSLNATVTNQGQSDETNVELVLLINGTIVDSTNVPLLQAGNSYTLSYPWTPTVECTYNVTAYAHPVPGETFVENNQITKFVTVAVSPPSEVEVGVEAGDWIKHDYTVTGWPSGTPRPEWLKVEILSVEGTTATVRVTMHMSDGTEQSDTVNVDVATGSGTFEGLSGFVIRANSKTGDTIYMSEYGNITLDGETTRTYAGASRTVVYASFSQYGTELTYYWDKETGVMVEASTTSGGVTGTAKATETNMWEATPSPFWMQWWLWTIVAAGIIALAGAVYFLKKQKRVGIPISCQMEQR